ncbi:MAG: metallophosphoesterase, partial [Mycetocola sp.]
MRPATAGGLTLLLIAGLGAAATVPASAVELPDTLLSTADTVWTYSDSNTDPSAGSPNRLGWTLPGFDDSGWKNARGSFGAKNGTTSGMGGGHSITTLLNHYINGTSAPAIPTYHFRSDVTLTQEQIDHISALQATVTYDDALQVFVNGTKVAGFLDERVEAAPESERNLTYAGDSKGDPERSSFEIPVDALQPGENTISV